MKRIQAKIFEYKAELLLDDSLTLINGDSAIGKTLLFNYFERQSYGSSDIHCFNAKYIYKLNNNKTKALNEFSTKLKSIKNGLIVIDNADTILNDAIREQIAYDGNNTYIIFGRNVTGLWVTENNIARLVKNTVNKKLYLDYYFKDVNKR